MRLAIALIAATLGGAAQAQLLPMSQALSPRPLPHGVSIPAVTSSSVSYPGCPGEVTTHTHTYYFDQVNGHTQSGGGLGTLAAPWDNLQAITGNNAGTPSSGYTQILLSTAPGGNGSSPIIPGDLIVVNTGSYGAVGWGALGGGSTAIVNNPAITIVAGAGQTPLLTTLTTSEFTGLHIGSSLASGLKVQSVNPGGVTALVEITDNFVAHSSSDIILDNMDVSSGTVAAFNALTPATTWGADTRIGVYFYSQSGTAPSNAISCASLVNSHIYEAGAPGLSAVEGNASSMLIQGNQIDHILSPAINFWGSNTAIGYNNIHDFVDNGIGNYQKYAIENQQNIYANPSAYQSNVYIYNNIMKESVDAGQAFQSLVSFYLNSCGDVTNFVIWDNLAAGGGGTGIGTGNSHNFVVANNSIMGSGTGQDPEYNFAQGHCGTTGPKGIPPSNGWVFNNIGPGFNNSNSAAIQAYHNIIASSAIYQNFTYYNGWLPVYDGPTPGSVITVEAASGQQNLIDGGVGGANPEANEYTAVPAANSFPMNPQPDWTPKAGSPAKTAGAVQLIPPLPDYNGVTPNNSIGALN
jgi:hypothetical protein